MGSRLEVSHVRFAARSRSDSSDGLLGWVSFTLGGSLRVEGVFLRRTLSGRLTLSFPSRFDRSGRKRFFLRPVDDTARREIEAQVFRSLGFEQESLL